ncbi:MAG TPA: GPP34 family phosphoprotein [Jatrophihabitans sp.]|nr:GPP34 family phosphoprotein [Jatrophihabitans sp.]
MPADTEELALAVCRLSLHSRGRLRHPHQVGIAVRAALFTELARTGRLVGRVRPEAVGESDTGNPLADALHRAVASRRPALWKRWYSHVDADRRAATEALIAAGRWSSQGRRLVDADAGATALQQQRVAELLMAKQAPDNLDLTLLVLLAGGHGTALGRPAPIRSRRLTKLWLEPQLLTSGHGGDATVAAVFYALSAMRRAHTVPFLSR